MANFEDDYRRIREGGIGFYEQKRGLIAVWGKEAVQFLDGMITNDMKTLEDGQQMLAAFPNAQGRLLAVVRVLREGERFLIETEEATREKVFQNLFRFTFAGDFFVEDISEHYQYFQLFGEVDLLSLFVLGMSTDRPVVFEGTSTDIFVPYSTESVFRNSLVDLGAESVSSELAGTLRIESGVPGYGIDMDDTTIVPELGLDGMISYNKGCYIGQEIIARIYFRGHVAKRLSGLTFDSTVESTRIVGAEVLSLEGKGAGRITSATFSPGIGKTIALGYVRYEFLSAGTELLCGDEKAVVTELPFAVAGRNASSPR
jgi:folate-binding protein YgfZ